MALTLTSYNGYTSDGPPEKFFDDPEVIALVKAAARGNVDEIDQLVTAGVDINTIGMDGITPLHWLMISSPKPNKLGFQHLVVAFQ